VRNLTKLVLFTNLLYSGIPLAKITSDSWNVDARYGYSRTSGSYQDTATINSASVNFSLDKDVDESTSVSGIFTLHKSDINNANTLAFDSADFVQQLYVSHIVNDDTEIKVGKQVLNYDHKKAVQDLGMYGGACNPSSKKICNGVLSLYVKKDIDENTELEFLAGGVDDLEHSKGAQYAAHIKHKKGINTYHLTLDKIDSEILYKYSSGQYNYTKTGDMESSRISLAMEIEDTGKDKYYLSHSRRISDSNTILATIDTLNSSDFPDYVAISEREDEYTELGKIIFLDKLFIKARIIRSKYSNKYSGHLTHRLLTGSVTATSNIDFTMTGPNLYFEYPLESGKVSSSHGYLSSDNTSVIASRWDNRADIVYDLSKGLSSTLSYYSFNGDGLRHNYLSFEIRHSF